VGDKEFGRNSCIFICDLVLVLASDGEMSGWKLEWFMLIDFYGLLDRNWKERVFMTLKVQYTPLVRVKHMWFCLHLTCDKL
jgi:hypothetical protein